MTLETALAVGLVTLASGTICLAVLHPFLASRQLVDVPNHRSSHSQPTVRGGGVGIVIGLLVGLALGVLLLAGSPIDLASTAAVGLTVGALATVGFAEDLFGLRVGARLLAQAVVLGVASTGLVLVHGIPVLFGLVAGLAGVFYVNAANFMDGVNGISSMHGAVVGAYFAVVGLLADDLALMLTSTAVSVAFLTFLPWNVPRAKMFMGDVGSYALGGSAWALAVWALAMGAPLVTAVAPLIIYSADVAFTLVRRAARKAPLTEAHREHVYQRVEQITQSHRASTGLATIATVLCASLGLWNLLVPGEFLWVTSGILVITLTYVFLPQVLAPRPALASSEVDR